MHTKSLHAGFQLTWTSSAGTPGNIVKVTKYIMKSEIMGLMSFLATISESLALCVFEIRPISSLSWSSCLSSAHNIE